MVRFNSILSPLDELQRVRKLIKWAWYQKGELLTTTRTRFGAVQPRAAAARAEVPVLPVHARATVGHASSARQLGGRARPPWTGLGTGPYLLTAHHYDTARLLVPQNHAVQQCICQALVPRSM